MKTYDERINILHQIYQIFLDRQADESSINVYYAITDTDANIIKTIDLIMLSDEFNLLSKTTFPIKTYQERIDILHQLYKIFLNRPVDETGIHAYYNFTENPINIKKIIDSIYISDEYKSIHSLEHLSSQSVQSAKPNLKLDLKEEFRSICLENLDNIRQFNLPEILIESQYEAVLIEYRCLPHLEFLIRNTINKLGLEWSHTVVCGNLNYDFMVNMCQKISNDIKIIRTNYDNLTPKDYSRFLASFDFWNLLNGEKILIYQEDSIIFKTNIRDYLHWDYIGAPWSEDQNINISGVGNGGLSLRTKTIMKQIINEISYSNNSEIYEPEDVFFTKNMEILKIGLLADKQSAFDFSTEIIVNKNSFGGHQFWLNDPTWSDRIYNNIIYVKLINSCFSNISFEKIININHEINNHTYDNLSNNCKICIIYNYHEIKNSQKSQTNLGFFIKYGLDGWQNIDITTLIVINGFSEMLLPDEKNIHVINTNYYYTIYDSICFFEKKYNKQINEQFSHFFIINSNVIGPIYENNLNKIEKHWLHKYLLLENINKCAVGNSNSFLFNLNNINNLKQIVQLDIFTNENYNANVNFLNGKLGYEMNLPYILNSHYLLSENNKSCVVYCHYDSDNIIKDYIQQNLVILMILGYDILFYTSSKKIINYDEEKLPFKINYYSNQSCGAGTDWYMWLDGCKKLKDGKKKYEWIMLLNDSTIIGINGIQNMKNSIENMRNQYDFFGHWDSNEIEYHYHSSYYEFKEQILDVFIDFANMNLKKCQTKQDVIMNCEVKFISYLKNLKINNSAIIRMEDYDSMNCMLSCSSHRMINLQLWINDKKAFAVKWKYMLPYLNGYFVSTYFCELLKYVYIGKYIGHHMIFPIINNLNVLTDIKKSKICVIYVYYERLNEQKNQTNLSFFIKYGLNKKNWLNLDITYLFVINGHKCEVSIPSEHNIHILKEDNCSDFEGWFNGIKYFENLYGIAIYDKFDYLCLINASTNGPFMNEDINNHWLIPFYDKMIQTNSVACSPYINNLKYTHDVPGLHLSCHFTLIKINKLIIDLLTNTIIPNTIKNISYYNTVIGQKKDKLDAINTGEYGLSRILILNNLNVCCLYFDNNIPILNHITNENREEFFHKNNESLKKTIFIKNIWRMSDSYASLPILYDYCMNFTYNKLKMNNIFENTYDNLNIYEIAEQKISFPTFAEKNNSCVIYAHFDSNNIIADYVISSIKSLIILKYDILFYTTSEKINNIYEKKLPFKINYLKNEGVGMDWKIWLNGLYYIKNNELNYDWIFLINDSLLFPINGITNFKMSIIEMRKTSDFWGHWESDEIRWHLIKTPIEFKYNMINYVIEFISTTLLDCKTSQDYVEKMETCFANFLIGKKYKYNVIINKTEIIDSNKYTYPTHNPHLIHQWINKKKSFAIKWKYCMSYLNENIVSKEFNYLTKFLYYGPYGTISNISNIETFPKSEKFIFNDFFGDINIQNININNTTRLGLIASYSKDISYDDNFIMFVNELSNYVDILLVASNKNYSNTKNIYFYKYDMNVGMDFGIYLRLIYSLKNIIIEFPTSIIFANDTNILINKLDDFFNWQQKYNDCLLGMTENDVGWGNPHLMSNFLLFKGNAVKYCFDYFIDYNLMFLFKNLNDIDYYKNFILTKFPNIECFKKYSNDEYYYTYIVFIWEMAITQHIINNKLQVIAYLSREYLINNYNFYGVPIFENYDLFFKLLPITKVKVIINNNLQNVVLDLQKNNLQNHV